MIQYPNPPGRPWVGFISADKAGKSPCFDPAVFGAGFSPRDISGLQAWYDVSAVVNSGNYIRYSEQFSSWTRSRVNAFGTTDTGGAGAGSFANTMRTTDPLGTNTADFIQEDATAANSHSISITTIIPTSVTSFRISIYAKAAGRTQGQIYLISGGVYAGVIYDLTAVTVTNYAAGGASIISKSITAKDNGWFYITAVINATFAASPTFFSHLRNLNENYNGDNTSGLFMWGASAQDITWEDRYIPTGANPIFPNAQADAANAVVNLRDLSYEADKADGRGNRILQSQDFNTTWTANEVTVIANGTTGPDGTTTADEMRESVNNAAHFVEQTVSARLNAGNYTCSCYIKPNGRTWAQIVVGSVVNGFAAYFDLTTPAVGTLTSGGIGTALSASAVSVGNGWILCTVNGNFSALITPVIDIMAATGDLGSPYIGDGVSGLYLWGCSLRDTAWSNDYVRTASINRYPFRYDSFRDLYQGTGSAQPLLSRVDNKGNYLIYSDLLTNAAWIKRGTCAIAAGVADPDGGNNAFAVSGVANGLNDFYQYAPGAVTSAENERLSLYIQRVSAAGVVRLVNATSSTEGQITIDLSQIGAGWVEINSGAAGITIITPWKSTTAGGTGIRVYTTDVGPLSFNVYHPHLISVYTNNDYVATTSFMQLPGLAGKPTLYFNGTSHFLKTPQFSLTQPETVYAVISLETWTLQRSICDGYAIDSMVIYNQAASPRVGLYAGLAGPSVALILGSFANVGGVFNGGSSLISAGITSSSIGNPGLANGAGFTLGAAGTGAAWANIRIAEVLIYNEAHDAPTRLRIQQYLANKWCLPL